jgi:hypothetical protein
MRRCGCVAVGGGRGLAPRQLTLAHGQPSWQQHRCCGSAGPGRSAADQHDADSAGVRLCCVYDEVLRWQRAPTIFASAHLHISLRSNQIGDAGARDLGATLLVNTTLTSLK